MSKSRIPPSQRPGRQPGPAKENDRDPAVIFQMMQPGIRKIIEGSRKHGHPDYCAVLLCDFRDRFARHLFTELQGKETVAEIEEACAGRIPIGTLAFNKKDFHHLIDNLFDEETTRGIMNLFPSGRTIALICANNQRVIAALALED